MLEVQESEVISSSSSALETPDIQVPVHGGRVQVPQDGPGLVVARGVSLFREGDAKDGAYFVDAGIFCLTEQRPSGPPAVIATAFAGEILGLGFLDRHSHSAIAVVESTVTRVPLEAIPMLCELSADVRGKQDAALEQEFETRRRELTSGVPVLPMVRVAAFLVAVAQSNAREGHDANTVTQSLRSGEVAQLLGMDIDVLALALAGLQSRKLIERNPEGGLRILSEAGLDALAMDG